MEHQPLLQPDSSQTHTTASVNHIPNIWSIDRRIALTLRKYIPLLAGILIPLATFLNMQSVSVPGWTCERLLNLHSGISLCNAPGNENCYQHASDSTVLRQSLSLAILLSYDSLDHASDDNEQQLSKHDSKPQPIATHLVANDSNRAILYPDMSQQKSYPVCRRSQLIVVLSFVSFGFGILATTCLFVRMLEKKIKWMTRLIILGGWGQGIVALITWLVFYSFSPKGISESYTAAVTYNAVSALVSLISAILFTFHHHTNQQQWYSYTLYELSLSQRQLTLLMITSLFYLTLSASVYSWIEDWVFDDSLYWAISSFSTIGFGDFAPKTTIGKVLLPPVTVVGIGLVGGLIWSLRDVVLELLTLQLASQYSKWLDAAQGESLSAGGGFRSSAANRDFGAQMHSSAHGDKLTSRHLSLTDTVRARLRSFSWSGTGSANELTPLTSQSDENHYSKTHPESEMSATVSSSSLPDSSLNEEMLGKGSGQETRTAAYIQDVGGLANPLSKLNLKATASASALDIGNSHATSKFLLPSAAWSDPIGAASGRTRLACTNSASAVDTFPNLAEYMDSPSPYHYRHSASSHHNHLTNPSSNRQQTMTISRSHYLPQVTIVANGPLAHQKVQDATREALQFQILIGAILVLLNILLFGLAFSYIEQWQVWEGFYFAYCAITTIGYGDYTLKSNMGRSLFIWYIFLAIGSSTYLGSMVAELAMDQWTVTVDHIEKRVGRYERKAQLKKIYGVNGSKRRKGESSNGSSNQTGYNMKSISDGTKELSNFRFERASGSAFGTEDLLDNDHSNAKLTRSPTELATDLDHWSKDNHAKSACEYPMKIDAHASTTAMAEQHSTHHLALNKCLYHESKYNKSQDRCSQNYCEHGHTLECSSSSDSGASNSFEKPSNGVNCIPSSASIDTPHQLKSQDSQSMHEHSITMQSWLPTSMVSIHPPLAYSMDNSSNGSISRRRDNGSRLHERNISTSNIGTGLFYTPSILSRSFLARPGNGSLDSGGNGLAGAIGIARSQPRVKRSKDDGIGSNNDHSSGFNLPSTSIQSEQSFGRRGSRLRFVNQTQASISDHTVQDSVP
ncbi:hypothetical protein QVD99_001635 [Batrachochytrium dendrobatidis]|nr:hypothetical protein O5D80_000283 [Batrachochytrium dendrobatidis]KAK5671803.1 hypothetical protein QVD99_001635 [Batrachochytrium dendrobatidis]